MTDKLTENQTLQLEEILYSGSKIEAIKYYRDVSGQGLKESKEYIDALSKELQAKNPHRFAQSQKAGCASTLAICMCIGYFVC